MKQVPLTQGKFALVDDEDYERLSQYSWGLQKSASGGSYARGRVHGKKRLLHREVLELGPEDPDVDHWDSDGLNKKKSTTMYASPEYGESGHSQK